MTGATEPGVPPAAQPEPEMDPEMGPRPWPIHGSREGASYRIFRSRWDTLTNPRNGETMDRVVLETPDWVNVVAVTEAGEIVVVEQYRFGTGTVTIEIPGGMLEPGSFRGGLQFDPFYGRRACRKGQVLR